MTHNVDPKLATAFLKMAQSLDRMATAMEKQNEINERLCCFKIKEHNDLNFTKKIDEL